MNKTDIVFRLPENNFFDSEDDLVKAFIEKFRDVDILFGEIGIKGKYYEQIRIPEIGRVSDLIIRCGDSRLINIEFKLKDYLCVMKQATDHLKWADYSYICVPINALRTFPQTFVPRIVEANIGLLVGDGEVFVELIRAKHNTYKAAKDKNIRRKVLETLKGTHFIKRL